MNGRKLRVRYGHRMKGNGWHKRQWKVTQRWVCAVTISFFPAHLSGCSLGFLRPHPYPHLDYALSWTWQGDVEQESSPHPKHKRTEKLLHIFLLRAGNLPWKEKARLLKHKHWMCISPHRQSRMSVLNTALIPVHTDRHTHIQTDIDLYF